MNNRLSFRLIRMQIEGHPVLDDLDISFCDDLPDSASIYTTCIIGTNGTGKSHLMAAIASAFSEVQNLLDGGRIPKRRFSYTIHYRYLGDLYSLSNMPSSKHICKYIIATRNNHQIDLEDIMLPERVIASTMTVTDRFLAKSDSFYRYKGIRNEWSASTTGTRTILRKTVESLLDCMHSKVTFKEELGTLLSNLGLEPHLHISYRLRYKNLFLHPDMNVARLRDIFDNWQKYFPDRKHAPWGYANYERGLRDNDYALRAAANFLSEKSQASNRDQFIAHYDVMEDTLQFQRDADALRILTKLDLVSFPSINVVKKESEFGLESGSSGETHLLCQFIGIMADIRNGSLILIDEPENSSHPDWQMNYVGWLKEIFKYHSDSHFIIATHSPLILANMKASESTIIRLKRGHDNIIVDIGGMEKGCYSWTVDEILKEVMNMQKTNTDDYNHAVSSFENAIERNNREAAEVAFKVLSDMINPKNILLELFKIQKSVIDYDKDR